MKSKKIITPILVLSVLASTVVPAFAAEPNEVIAPLSNQGFSNVTLAVIGDSGGGGDTEPDNPDGGGGGDTDPSEVIVATVPVELPIIMDLDGNITVPTEAKIINHSTEKGIKVTGVDVELSSDWSAADFTDDFTAKADDTKELGLSFRGDTLKADGTFTATDGNWNIAKDSGLPLNMGAKIPKQTVESKGAIATIGFTIDWSGLDGADGGSDPDAGKDNSGGGEVNPPDAETVTVTFTTDGKGTLEGETTVTVKKGETATFPTANPASIRYELSNWIDNSTNSEIEPTAPIMADTTIKAVFDERAASPKNWFVATNETITGLSNEYLNMVDAPTDLVIPNNIGGSTIKAIGASAFANKDLITSIVIPESVNSIAADSFSGCSSLTEINLDYSAPYRIANSPFGFTDDKTIWGAAEAWDTNPMSLSQATAMGLSLDKSTGEIKAENFGSRGDITLPTSIDGVKITSISQYGFRSCAGLNSITIPGSITSIGDWAFERCRNLTSITISDGVTSIGGYAFTGCTRLTSIAILNSVTSIGSGAFEGCTGLTSITIPNSVTFINSGTFKGCARLTSITIPESVTAIRDYAFDGCTGLTSIIIPNNVTAIGDYVFNGCTGLTSITIPDGVTSIGTNAFLNVPHITYNGSATGAPWGAKSMN